MVRGLLAELDPKLHKYFGTVDHTYISLFGINRIHVQRTQKIAILISFATAGC